MQLSNELMFARALARDARFDGAFLTGVLTTGIYCLPSCPARKPLPENTRFFLSEAEAQAAGLRACKRCRPDGFYRGVDPDLRRVVALATSMRARPGARASVEALVEDSGFGASKVSLLFRRHFHLSPGAFLLRARVDAACRLLLRSRGSLLDIAAEVGFESASSFHEQFRRRTGLSPARYRLLREQPDFELRLPRGFRSALTLQYHGRDPRSLGERVEGQTLHKALLVEGTPLRLSIHFAAASARCEVESKRRLSPEGRAEVHRVAARLLGLGEGPAAFEAQLAQVPPLHRLARGREGARLPLTASPYEALVWAVLGQQVHLSFAFALRRALYQLAGEPVGGGLWAHPSAERVADLDPSGLRARQLSSRKAEYLLEASRQVATDELPLEALAEGTATEADRRLRAVRGIGPWTSQYVQLRGMGFADCLPVGDSGLAAALERALRLDARPSAEEQTRLLEPLRPHRSLATYHLWLSLGGNPT